MNVKCRAVAAAVPANVVKAAIAADVKDKRVSRFFYGINSAIIITEEDTEQSSVKG